MAIEQTNLSTEEGIMADVSAELTPIVYDHSVMSRLFQEYYEFSYRVCRHSGLSHEDAEDAAEETILKATRKIHQLKHVEKEKSWIARIAVRIAIGRTLRSPMHKKKRNLTYYECVDPDDAAQAALTMAQREAIRLVQEALEMLSEADRTLAQFFYYDELSLKEITELLHIPEGTVKRRLFTLRGRVKHTLLELCPDFRG